jgi:hypothetical protein
MTTTKKGSSGPEGSAGAATSEGGKIAGFPPEAFENDPGPMRDPATYWPKEDLEQLYRELDEAAANQQPPSRKAP